MNQATHTVYVTTVGKLNGWTVFDANTCNTTDQSGCRDVGHLPGDPAGPNDAEVDTANDTLYTANYDNTVSVFDLADCDASDLSGCQHDTPGTVTPVPLVGFDHDLWLAVDAPLHSVYVAYQKDDSLIVVDTDKCNGPIWRRARRSAPPEIHTGADPESVVVDDQTQTLYTANEVDNDVSVIDARLCNAQTTTGCRHHARRSRYRGGGNPGGRPWRRDNLRPDRRRHGRDDQHQQMQRPPHRAGAPRHRQQPRSASLLRRLPSMRSHTPCT